MVTKQQKKHHLKPQRKSPNRYMVKIVIVTRQYYWAAGEKLHSVSSVLNSNGTCCSEGSSVFKKIKEGLKVYNYGGRIRREARSLVGQWNPHPPPPTNWQPSPQAPSHWKLSPLSRNNFSTSFSIVLFIKHKTVKWNIANWISTWNDYRIMIKQRAIEWAIGFEATTK